MQIWVRFFVFNPENIYEMMTNNLKHTTHQWCRKVNPEPDKFEDDEFKEDNNALNDQGEGKGTNYFCPS